MDWCGLSGKLPAHGRIDYIFLSPSGKFDVICIHNPNRRSGIQSKYGVDALLYLQ